MATTTQNQSVWEVIPKWLPILVVIAGGISSFGYAMAQMAHDREQQAHERERTNRLEQRVDAVDSKTAVLEGDVRVILTNTEWIKEELKKRK